MQDQETAKAGRYSNHDSDQPSISLQRKPNADTEKYHSWYAGNGVLLKYLSNGTSQSENNLNRQQPTPKFSIQPWKSNLSKSNIHIYIIFIYLFITFFYYLFLFI